jgi:hypothetical protein
MDEADRLREIIATLILAERSAEGLGQVDAMSLEELRFHLRCARIAGLRICAEKAVDTSPKSA